MPLSSIQALKEELIKNLPQNFYQNRKIGENDTELCRLIREDSLELFINYISQNAIPLNYCIVPSFYETHRKIGDLTKRVNLIRYALFFGSTRIICFIQSNYCDQFFDLFNFAVYSNRIDVIKLVENTHFRPNTNTESMFKEAIGCHHNDIACYIQCCYMGQQQNLPISDPEKNVYAYSIHYRNFPFFPTNSMNSFLFYNFCKYSYFNMVEFYLMNAKIDLNMLYILKKK